jgi:hypothetical protein
MCTRTSTDRIAADKVSGNTKLTKTSKLTKLTAPGHKWEVSTRIFAALSLAGSHSLCNKSKHFAYRRSAMSQYI